MICYMRAKGCYHMVNPDDAIEKELLGLRDQAPDGDKKIIATNRMNDIRANAEALSIISQWIDVAYRSKIRRCNKASEA